MSVAARIVIRNLVGSASSVAALVSKQSCWICSLETRSALAVIALPSDCDGRVAFSSLADCCVVGGWESGLAGYRISDGQQTWRNRKAKRFTRIVISEGNHQIFLSETEPPGSMLVDLQSGKLVARDAEHRQAFYHPEGEGRVALNQKQELVWEAGAHTALLPWRKFAVLSGCFGNDRFAATSPNGEVVCYDLQAKCITGSTPGRPTFYNCSPIAYNKETMAFVGLVFDYEGSGCALVDFGSDCESVTPLARFPNVFAGAFLNGGTMLLTTSGDVWSATTGKLVLSLSWDSLT
jgi:hypothetical protein